MESEPTEFDWLILAVSAVGSVATLAAVIVAIVLGFHEVRKFREDEAQRENERRQREVSARRAQAEQVAGWLKFHPGPRSGSVGTNLGGFNVYADIINASARPIYEAKVHMHTAGSEFVVADAGTIPPGERGHVHLPWVPERPRGEVGAHIVFRDAAERWWERDDDGHLIEHDSDPWPRPERMTEQDPDDHDHE